MKRPATDDDNHTAEEAVAAPAKPLKFRNYKPKTAELKELRVEKPDLSVIENEVEEAAKQVLQKSQEQNEGALQLAPKKLNWDLKRDVEKKLEKLEAKTKKAIIELIRGEEAGGEMLAQAVSSASRAEQARDEESD
eukprot:GILJ01007654.1.p1 GENE.GILJ01007654.1~~GILJ01007654.1.p1  ORF type:complete len:136 (-),score=27.19 GILJ01007654.1:119-526(-)